MDDFDKFHIEKAREFLPKGYKIVEDLDGLQGGSENPHMHLFFPTLDGAKSVLPKGYVIVPIEPTEEMKHVFWGIYDELSFEEAYKAMISEAQK